MVTSETLLSGSALHITPLAAPAGGVSRAWLVTPSSTFTVQPTNTRLCASLFSSMDVLFDALGWCIFADLVFHSRKQRLLLRNSPCNLNAPEMPVPSFPAIPLTAYGPMAAAAAAAAVVRGTGNCHFPPWHGVLPRRFAMGCGRGVGQGVHFWDFHCVVLLPPVGSTPSRTGGFLGTTSPGPMAELYGAANQDSGVSSYISAASPAPSTGFGHSLGVSVPCWALHRGRDCISMQ